MQCPRLEELPEGPPGKIGWPWTEQSVRLADTAADGKPWPRISIITPSYNQGRFIEATIRSILLQGYPNLEYLVLDGGSTDETVEIIKKYSPWIDYWCTEHDGGQSDAINRGLNKASGLLATWINSDDMLCKNALNEHVSRYAYNDNTVYVGICVYIDQNGNFLSEHQGKVHSLEDLICVGKFWRSGGQIIQPEVLFPRELAVSVGGVNCDNHYTMDYELWGRLLLAGATLRYTDIPFGMFREHPEQKTHDPVRITASLLKAAAELVQHATCFTAVKTAELLSDLDKYATTYRKDYWKGTGRLARLGLPPKIVVPIRNLRAACKKMVEARAWGVRSG